MRDGDFYPGLYVAPIQYPQQRKVRWTVARMSQTYDGGMREFHDPVQDECIGCCGLHFAEQFVRPLEGWAPEPGDALAWESLR